MEHINVIKCNHNGEDVVQYRGELLARGNDWICLIATFEQPDTDLGMVTFRNGDVFTEWFFSDRWYNIFQVQDADDHRLKGWYCNITRPAQIDGDSVRAEDLALDIFVQVNGTIIMLDEDEFAALDLTTGERMAALRAVESIRQQVASREPPFDKVQATGPLGRS
ncbi:MAG: DUF402 domain-containing protein [Chloroflexi bacterium]|nr:MAG: DUF402 domain-containing protein [Chloroflexota bacterium]